MDNNPKSIAWHKLLQYSLFNSNHSSNKLHSFLHHEAHAGSRASPFLLGRLGSSYQDFPTPGSIHNTHRIIRKRCDRSVYQNLWGEADATSGSQTLTLDSESDGTVVWSTSWTWAGGSDDVKSYDNIALTTTGVKISSISSIPTVYHWR
jgi:hypothetical protein